MLKFIHCLILVLGFVGVCISQNISGFVIDAESEDPLVGVNVVFGNKGTVSDIDGSFTIDMGSVLEPIVFSYVGYERLELSVEQFSKESILVKMKSSTTYLDAAVVTGSRYERSISESPVSISILKPNLIENTNTFQMDDVLDKIPGVQLVEGQLNIRGGSGWSYGAGSRVLLLVDDMPALQGDAGRPNWTDIPVENISQVEVLKGASSSLYGSAALNGIVNIRTGFATSDPVTKISTSYTFYDDPADINKKWWGRENTISAPHTFMISGLHKQKFGKFDLVLNGFHLDENTVYEDGFNTRTRIGANTRYRLSDRLTIGLNALVNRNQRGDFFIWLNSGGGAYRAFPGAFSTGDSWRFNIDPSVTYFDKHNNKHRIQARYAFIDNVNNNNQSNASNTYFGEYQFLKLWEELDMSLTAGVSTQLIRSNSELFGDTITSSDNLAVYAQLEKELVKDLNVTVGWRLENNRLVGPKVIDGIVYDENEFSESKSVFRAGLNYKLADYTFLRGSWGQGYRFPTITEKYITTTFSSIFIFPNPVLESETGYSTELGIRQGFSLFGFQGFADLAGFISRYQNMTEFNATQLNGVVGFQAQNIGDTRIAGIELGVGGTSKIANVPVEIIAGISYIDPKYADFTDEIRASSSVDFNYLKYRTKYNWKFDISIEPIDKLNLGFSVNRTSHMVAIDRILSDIGTIGAYRGINNNGFYRSDLRVSYEWKIWKLSLLANNIFNEEIVIRPGILEAPRQFACRLDLSF